MRRFIPSVKKGISGFLLIAMCVAGLASLTQKTAEKKSNLDGRMLAQFELPTWESLLDGTWMKSTEDFVDDRIIGRTALLRIHAVVATKVLRSQEVAGVWIDPRNNMLFDKPPTLADPIHLKESLRELKKTTDEANVPLLLAYVPRKQEVFADRLPKHWTNAYVQDKPVVIDLLAQNSEVLDLTTAVGSPEVRDKNWFLTDHHWSSSGAIAASNAVRAKLNQMGLPAPQSLPPLDQVTKYRPFIGSIGRRLTVSGVPSKDTFEIAWPKQFNLSHCINEPITAEKCDEPLFFANIGNDKDPYANRYATFLRGDNPIDDLRGDGTGTYIVLKDSFGDAFVPYFALGAKRVVAIDERHFTNATLSDLIREVKPDGVIWLHNQLSLSLMTPEQLAIWK